MKKSFRKLKRLELVDMIYQLRKDNLEQRRRCQELERQLAQAESMLQAYASNGNEEALGRIEEMLEKLCGIQAAAAVDADLPVGDVSDAEPQD